MLRKDSPDKLFWALIASVCLIHGYLLIPNYDDGQYFYQIYNTIRFYNPFYSDFFGQPFHFMKPTTILYALLYSINENPSFRLIAYIQSIEIFACAGLIYLSARRYVSKEISKAGTLMFLYLVLSQYWLTPTRPETTVLLCCLAVFWLCELFSTANKVKYLIFASAITFLVAIPMHTNGTIPLSYLILYTLTQRQRLSRISFIKLTIFSTIFAAFGFAIVVYPSLSSLAESLALLSLDSKRFDMFGGEYKRIMNFARHYYFFPWVVFISAVFCGCLFHGYKKLNPTNFKRYLNLILFFLAALLGLLVLPSAPHEIYTIYYYLPLVLGFSIAFDYYKNGNLTTTQQRLILILTGIVILWYSYGTMPKLYYLFFAGPFFITAVLIRRISAMQVMLIVIIPMLLFRSVGMISSKIIYERVEQKIHEAPGLVLTNSLFNFSARNVFPLCGYETQVFDSQGIAIVELKSVAERKTEKISSHPLVDFFGATTNPNKRSKWDSRRKLGHTFQVIDSNLWKMLDYIDSQVRPLNYTIINEIPLSNKFLDKYADGAMRGLKLVEYKFINNNS